MSQRERRLSLLLHLVSVIPRGDDVRPAASVVESVKRCEVREGGGVLRPVRRLCAR